MQRLSSFCCQAAWPQPAASWGSQIAMPWLELSDTFCRYVGGIAGTDSGLFGYFVLALFWAPSSCTANNSVLGGFCSNFTGAGSYAAHNLVLHGERLAPLWGGKHLLGTPPVPSACDVPPGHHPVGCLLHE